MTAGTRRSIRAGAWVIALGTLTTTLQGCFPLVAAGIGTTALVADDRRTSGIMVEDENIENKILLRVEQKHGAKSHINATSYNRIVLLTGEATSPDVREDIERIARSIENVRTGRVLASAIAATTAEESIPPERKAPSGTSAMSRRRVALRIASRMRSHSSSCETPSSFLP